MDFPEGSYLKAPRGFRVSLWSPSFSAFLELALLTQINEISKIKKEENNMSKFKIVGMIALIAFAMGIFWVGDAVAGERGKIIAREVEYVTTVQTLKVPDVEGHTIHLVETKGIGSNEKWGAYLIYQTYTMDLINVQGTHQGYAHATFPDGSTMDWKFEGKTQAAVAVKSSPVIVGSPTSEGTSTYIKGTGKFQGIQGRATYKVYALGPGQFYVDAEGEYTLP